MLNATSSSPMSTQGSDDLSTTTTYVHTIDAVTTPITISSDSTAAPSDMTSVITNAVTSTMKKVTTVVTDAVSEALTTKPAIDPATTTTATSSTGMITEAVKPGGWYSADFFEEYPVKQFT